MEGGGGVEIGKSVTVVQDKSFKYAHFKLIKLKYIQLPMQPTPSHIKYFFCTEY